MSIAASRVSPATRNRMWHAVAFSPDGLGTWIKMPSTVPRSQMTSGSVSYDSRRLVQAQGYRLSESGRLRSARASRLGW